MNILNFIGRKNYNKERYDQVKHFAYILNTASASNIFKAYNGGGERVRTHHNVPYKQVNFKYRMNPLELKYGKA